MRTLDTGWFAKEDVFAYQRPEPPRFAAGGDAWLESTPPVLVPFQALAGLEVTLELGVERIREYNLAQKAVLQSLLPVQGAGDDHGAFVTLRNPRAKALSAPEEGRQDRRARRVSAHLPRHAESASGAGHAARC